MVAWERECRGLLLEEMGALWTLTAAAECGWFGTDGVMRATGDAIAAMMGIEPMRAEELLCALKKRGRLKYDVEGADTRTMVYTVQVCLWNDRWAHERESKRRNA